MNIQKDKDTVKAIMKTKKEVFPNFEKDYQLYLAQLQAEEKAKNQAEFKNKLEEEKQQDNAIKAKKKEIDDFFDYGDEDDKVFAGGDNQHLEDDFM